MYFPKVSKPRPILFDLGDTLLNSSATNPVPFFTQSARLAYDFMAARGLALPSFSWFLWVCRHRYLWAFLFAELRRSEVDLHRIIQRLLRSLHLPHDQVFVLALAECFYQPMKRLNTVEEGLFPILDALRQRGHPLGIVSNTMVPGPVLDQHLQDIGLLKYFPVRIYSCDVGVKKPHRQIFLAALRALNIRPQSTVFVGDKSDLDVKGARRVGMITVLKVRVGMPPTGRHRADYVIKHLTELPGLLDQIGHDCRELTPSLPPEDLPVPQFRPRTYQPLPTVREAAP